MYYKKMVIVNDRIFVTKCSMGMYGNSRKRAARTKPTSEVMERHNIRKAIEYVYYLMLLNFKPGDLHCVFTYPRGIVQTVAEAKALFRKFIRKYRAYCHKHGYKCDYIYNSEIGQRGAIHHHCLLHYHRDERDISMMWEEISGGKIQTKSYLWANYDWYGLADYLVDKTKGGKQPDTHVPGERRYIPSQGLIKPTVQIERVEAARWYKPKAPKGYYIDPNSIYSGKDELTGGCYIKYTLRRQL